jgi:hypothetical protein
MNTLNELDLIKIEKLSNDIKNLREFLDVFKLYKGQSIKAMYLVFDSGNQIEFKGHFSKAASDTLIDLIVQSRESILVKLNEAIRDLALDVTEIQP